MPKNLNIFDQNVRHMGIVLPQQNLITDLSVLEKDPPRKSSISPERVAMNKFNYNMRGGPDP